MLLKILNDEHRILRIYEHLNDGGIVQLKMARRANPDILFIIPNDAQEGVTINTHFLPWRADTGYYIDLPTQNVGVTLFLTAELTGCCVGVQRIPDGSIRVCHYNSQGEDFDRSDFERYNNGGNVRHWLIPERYGLFDNTVYYGGYHGGADPTCFWGEFDGVNWKFYYQTPDKVIHNFAY